MTESHVQNKVNQTLAKYPQTVASAGLGSVLGLLIGSWLGGKEGAVAGAVLGGGIGAGLGASKDLEA